MFQTISSFLPPVLQLSNDKVSPVSPDTPKLQAAPTGPVPMQRAGEEQAVKRQKERKNESFIVVRPPPSMSNHPLNLQVQLVPPSNKDKDGRSSRPSSRHSMDSSVEAEVSLSRTPSNRSEASLYSSYSSTGSFSTLGSTSSSSSGRRMIIPLYNLQAHNVMQNVIVDAGTDAKIAKFMKRGLEVIGLAVLEPIEIWTGGTLEDDSRPRASSDHSQGLQPPGSNTPTSSAVSLASETTQDLPAPMPTPATLPAFPAPSNSSSGRPGTPRKFFGKLFSSKKKDSASTSGLTPPVTPTSPVTSFAGDSRVSKRSSLLSAHGHPAMPNVLPELPLQPPVLGIQPSLRSATVPPRGRPHKYVWVVRKWLKGEPESMLGGMRDRFNEVRVVGGLAPSGGLEANVEVRLEWSRGKKRSGEGEQVTRKVSRRRSGQPSSATPSTVSLQQQAQTPMSPVTPIGLVPPSRKSRTRSPGEGGRQSIDSVRSTSPGPAASITTGESTTQESREHDDGDDSDPEDSETPWTCTLVVRRLHPAVGLQTPTPRSPLADESAQPQSLRVKVAAVVPTPHHPKVVALLKVPFPLPDVEIERVAVRRRIVTPAGISRPAPDAVSEAGGGGQSKLWSGSGKENGGERLEIGRSAGMVLTAEEIKDVVSCTGLWLVVREGFGGVGRERRKGDRWRLRG